jgi:antitoxin MazE
VRTKVQKWGNSLALRIPHAFAGETGIAQDSEVELSLEDGKLVVTPLDPSEISLEGLLAGVTEANRHPEVDWGPGVGGEAW